MTSNNNFFTNTRHSAICCGLGFLFLFASAFWAQQIQLIWGTIIIAGFFLLLALFFIMKEYDKEYEQVKQL